MSREYNYQYLFVVAKCYIIHFMDNVVGDNLRRIRESQELTQEKLALSADVTQGCINFIESGKRGYSKKSLRKISAALKISVSKLFEEKPNRQLAETTLEEEYRMEKEDHDEIIGLLNMLPDSVIKHYKLLLKAEINIRNSEEGGV